MRLPTKLRLLNLIAPPLIVLQDQTHFEFKTQKKSWQTCDIITIVYKFCEGREIVILPRGTLFICERAMYALDATKSMINCCDLRAIDINDFTVVENDEDVLKLKRGPRRLATAHAIANGLYDLCIMQAYPVCKNEEDASEH